jgi:hypothetical protein
MKDEEGRHGRASGVLDPMGPSAIDAVTKNHEAAKVADLVAWYSSAREVAVAERDGKLLELAVRFRCTPRTLRSAALVGRRIKPEEFSRLAKWRDAQGRPLTRSVLIALAKLSLSERERLLSDLILAERKVVKARDRASRRNDHGDHVA